MMGTSDDWTENEFCFYQFKPVPMGATVEYPCAKLLFGHFASVNKSMIPQLPKEYRMLMLHEVQIFGYKAGK